MRKHITIIALLFTLLSLSHGLDFPDYVSQDVVEKYNQFEIKYAPGGEELRVVNNTGWTKNADWKAYKNKQGDWVVEYVFPDEFINRVNQGEANIGHIQSKYVKELDASTIRSDMKDFANVPVKNLPAGVVAGAKNLDFTKKTGNVTIQGLKKGQSFSIGFHSIVFESTSSPEVTLSNSVNGAVVDTNDGSIDLLYYDSISGVMDRVPVSWAWCTGTSTGYGVETSGDGEQMTLKFNNQGTGDYVNFTVYRDRMGVHMRYYCDDAETNADVTINKGGNYTYDSVYMPDGTNELFDFAGNDITQERADLVDNYMLVFDTNNHAFAWGFAKKYEGFSNSTSDQFQIASLDTGTDRTFHRFNFQTGGGWGDLSFYYFDDIDTTTIDTNASPLYMGGSGVHWWKLNGDGFDQSENVNTMALQGDATYDYGYFGQSLSLDGSGDYMDSDDTTAIDSLTTGTVMAWVKSTDDNDVAHTVYLVGREADGTNTQFILQNDWNRDRIYARLLTDSTYEWNAQMDDNSISALSGEWFNIAVVQDGIEPKIYIDGSLVTTTITNIVDQGAWFDDLFSASSPADTMLIGAYKSGASISNYFDGQVDDVRIFDRALDSNEIQEVMQNTMPSCFHTDVGCSWKTYNTNDYAFIRNATHIWDFNEGTGTTETDEVSHIVIDDFGAPSWVSGKEGYGMALDFDGMNEYAETGEIKKLEYHDTGTISFWANIDLDDDAFNVPFSIGDADTGFNTILDVSFDMRDSKQVYRSSLYVDSANLWYIDSTTPLTSADAGVWRMITIVQNGVAPKMYIDGVRETTTYIGSSDTNAWINELFATGVTNKADKLMVGASATSTATNNFDGQIDDLLIWDYALDSNEVSRLYDYYQSGHYNTTPSWSPVMTHGGLYEPTKYISYLYDTNAVTVVVDSNTYDCSYNQFATECDPMTQYWSTAPNNAWGVTFTDTIQLPPLNDSTPIHNNISYYDQTPYQYSVGHTNISIDNPLNTTYFTQNITAETTFTSYFASPACWENYDDQNITSLGNLQGSYSRTIYDSNHHQAAGDRFYTFTCEANEDENATITNYFTIDDWEFLNETYSADSNLENSLQNYTITYQVNPDLITNFTAYHRWNDTSTIADLETLNGYNNTFKITNFELPSITTNNYTQGFNYNITQTYSNDSFISSLTSNNTQIIYGTLLTTDCVEYPTVTANITTRDEDTQDLEQTRIDSHWWIRENEEIVYSTGIQFTDSNFYELCAYPSWASFEVSAEFRYWNETLVKRQYFVLNETYDSNTREYTLYNIDSDRASEVEITVLDENSDPLVEHTVFLNKYFLINDTYVTVAMLRTDTDGQSITYLNDTEAYQTIVYNTTNNVVKTSTKQFINDDILTITVLPEDVLGLFKEQEGIRVTDTYNNDTKLFTITIIDENNRMSATNLTAWTNSLSPQVVCSTAGTGTTFTSSCNFENVTSNSVRIIARSTFPDGTRTTYSQIIQILNIEDQGVFLLIGIVVVCVFIFYGLSNPALGSMVIALPLFFLYVAGFTVLRIETIVSIFFVGIITMYATRRKGGL